MKMHRAGSFCIVVVGLVGAVAGAEEARDRIVWKACLSQRPGWYSGQEAVRIADNLLLYQRASGGWPKNTEMAAVLSDEQKAQIASNKGRTDSTIDNGATCRPLRYLAKVYNATKQRRFRTAFLKGLDYLFEAQYAHGGWPQFFPNASGYKTHITFNDNAMVNVMTLLSDIRDRRGDFSSIDERRRAAASRAVEKGIECILKCQIVIDDKRLGWCAQHDEKTFAPRPARSYEKASLSGSEGAAIVRFLMTIEEPTPEIVAAIEGAVLWFDQVRITGLREVREPAPGTERGYDKKVIVDPNAPPMWARFYQIGTNRAIFCSRDGIIRYRLAEISYERRNGYSWYTTAPAALLAEDYPAWRKKHTQGRDILDR